MLKAYDSSLYVGLRSAEYCFQTLSNTKILCNLVMITPKPWDCNSFTCRKTSYWYLGRQHFSSSPSPVHPHAKPTCSMVSRPTLLPLIQFYFCLLYLHRKLHCGLPGFGIVSLSLGSAEQKGALPFSWGPVSDCTMQIIHARKSLPQWLVNVVITIGYLLHKFRLHN